MKKSTLFIAALICMMMQTVSTFAQDTFLPKEQLPASIKTFVQELFPGQIID